MKKRILSLVLTAAMLLTLVPVFATSAAAEETYTITYTDGTGTRTQEITGTGLVAAPTQTKTPSANSGMFYHWAGSDGNIYTPGQIITPTANLTLTAKTAGDMGDNGWTGWHLIMIDDENTNEWITDSCWTYFNRKGCVDVYKL